MAFSRDHLDAGAMAHPNIMTESMQDGSDAIADWPLLDAMLLCSSRGRPRRHPLGRRRLCRLHDLGRRHPRSPTARPRRDERLNLALTNDTPLGVMRYADAGYEDSLDEIEKKHIPHLRL